MIEAIDGEKDASLPADGFAAKVAIVAVVVVVFVVVVVVEFDFAFVFIFSSLSMARNVAIDGPTEPQISKVGASTK